MVDIRPSGDFDIPAITEIYKHAVLKDTGTFDITPPARSAMLESWRFVQSRNLPWLVAEDDGGVAGYASARPFRDRAAYNWLVEDAVYVHPDYRRKGLGSALLGELIAACSERGIRQMLALIGDSENVSSIRLHQRHGFNHAGVVQNAGFKFDRWLDLVIMQRQLGPGGAEPPRDS